ncbi:MAG TPA: hypothetical protein VGV07_02825 [Devosia sp.]|jgi:hypothetical protein|uniref:hypothetical protein n=1 Tax=Devosia sp. TaxID=1871048 RepID=UPI002DDCF672|nr:hypothetical protein [Devosia sp.]HEV2514159.1 hypothetical protein [Devosia sp.]
MPSPKLDLTINLGHVITFGGLLVTMAIGWATFDGRLRAVERTLETATATLVEQVRQGAELSAVSERVDRLERMAESRP